MGKKPTATPGAYTNLPEEVRRDVLDWMALHPEGPQNLTDFLVEAIEAKIARDRRRIEALRTLRAEAAAEEDKCKP